MTETWFISDTHFGHENILDYEKESRPFNSLEEMHECIIDRWNSVVHDRDVVFHLGDFCFGRHNIDIAQRLNGKKRLILGNHDTYPAASYAFYFEKLYGVYHYHRCILSHIPVHPDCLGSRWPLNVHGHFHSRNVKIPNEADYIGMGLDIHNHPDYFNVSCEQNNLTPINFDVIRERIKLLE